jgi:copper chaperone NosL
MKSVASSAYIFLILFILLFASCSQEHPAVNYGKDLCHLCKMTIMDKKFGAVMVNPKGKQIKFDSGECMVNYMKTDKDFEAERYLITNYSSPGTLIDAGKAFYLHGGEVRSPMGGKLAAFEAREDAEKFQQQLNGDLILWADVMQTEF